MRIFPVEVLDPVLGDFFLQAGDLILSSEDFIFKYAVSIAAHSTSEYTNQTSCKSLVCNYAPGGVLAAGDGDESRFWYFIQDV